MSTHIKHINLNTILYARRGQSYQNNLHNALYGNTHAHTQSTKRQLTIFNVLWQKDNKKWRDQVVDSLNVATGWMPNCPYVQYPLKDLESGVK